MAHALGTQNLPVPLLQSWDFRCEPSYSETSLMPTLSFVLNTSYDLTKYRVIKKLWIWVCWLTLSSPAS